ncbi:receiver box response regulator [Natronomonas pharaonis DSM 2160]|uniref:Receiver box response regulator n=1 Tax=Natronomonas pharaonis (strain ATCC 35678 / DSM 2160 / CIP 103997 / JCM 8858 / NBRC 14720 / NCIMB 2260 / Gabara) TaxID=348780 RepID=A0A1U7EVG8_NATPD|nr:GAF domain-containing protein [Natronomonas pharaonis]CAI49014.2 receiver box response regulator [Natronomonas pharaonis DSM 2160]
MAQTVLCVDTPDRVSTVTDAVAAGDDLNAVSATSVSDATEVLIDDPVVCVVTAYDLSDGTGLDIVGAIREHAPQTPCVLFTDASPGEIDTAAFEETIVEYLNRDLPDADERLSFVVDDVISHSAQVGFLAPKNEGERLETLAAYDVDALPIEDSFDRLTDLIADRFDVAVSFIGLIEREEENFLACTGADWDSLTREDTICTHSMLQEDVMVVEDIDEDKRFSENEQLHDLGIVSYAGANMTAPDGSVIGQVCVLDHEPRSYDAGERETLQQYAETAMEILELRRRLHELDSESAATEVDQ